MKIFAVNVRGEFRGLYEWGIGFVSAEKMRKWDEFWQERYSSRWGWWRYIRPKGIGECGHLISTTNNIYLHPMNFSTVLVDTGGCCCVGLKEIDGETREVAYHFSTELKALEDACKECAEYCGVEFEMFTNGKELEISVDDTDVPYEDGVEGIVREKVSW